jgi:hypothetical protein
MIFLTMSPDENYASLRFGPKIKPGLMIASSNFSSSGKFEIKSHAAFSARVLLFS